MTPRLPKPKVAFLSWDSCHATPVQSTANLHLTESRAHLEAGRITALLLTQPHIFQTFSLCLRIYTYSPKPPHGPDYSENLMYTQTAYVPQLKLLEPTWTSCANKPAERHHTHMRSPHRASHEEFETLWKHQFFHRFGLQKQLNSSDRGQQRCKL